jgi:hypothetical protein
VVCRPRETVRLAVPASLYTLQNNLLILNPIGGVPAPGNSAAGCARLPLHAAEQSVLILNPIGGVSAPGDSAAGCARLPLHAAEQSPHSCPHQPGCRHLSGTFLNSVLRKL